MSVFCQDALKVSHPLVITQIRQARQRHGTFLVQGQAANPNAVCLQSRRSDQHGVTINGHRQHPAAVIVSMLSDDIHTSGGRSRPLRCRSRPFLQLAGGVGLQGLNTEGWFDHDVTRLALNESDHNVCAATRWLCRATVNPSKRHQRTPVTLLLPELLCVTYIGSRTIFVWTTIPR